MITITLDESKLQLRLSSMPAAIHRKLVTTIAILAEKLRSHIVTNKLTGQVLNRRTGRLGRSIQYRVDQSPSSVQGVVYSAGDVPYAQILEYGGRTSPHIIEARNGKALAFNWNGRDVFYKRVNHPGSVIKEYRYMRGSLDDMRQEIIDRMTSAVKEGASL